MAINLQGTAQGAGAGAVFGPVGAGIGAGIGLVSDILGGRERRKAKKRAIREQNLALAYNTRALAAQTFEARYRAMQDRDRAQRGVLLGIDLFEASAAASGVGGNSVQAIKATRSIELGELMAESTRQMESIDAEYERQRSAAAIQAHFNIANALNEIEAAEGNLFDLAAGALLTFGAFKSTGVFDKTVKLGGVSKSPLAGTYKGGGYYDSVPPGPTYSQGPTKGAWGYN